MTLHIPARAAAGLILAVLIATALFLFLSERFGGPAVRLESPYRVVATLPDSKGLAERSDVLVRGVSVGRVDAISVHGQRATVTLALDGKYAPVHRDATVRVGEKTLLGEAYVDLDRGHRQAPALPSGARLPADQTLPAAVEIDQALEALDAGAQERMRSVLGTFAAGAGSPRTPERVERTIARLDRLTGELRDLTDALQGQQGDIAAGVRDGRTALGQLAARETEIRELVASGRATLQAMASNRVGLRRGLRELPRLLGTAETALRHARPLLTEARPLLVDLRRASAPLSAAATDLRPVAADAERVVAGVPALNAALIPFLARTRGVLDLARPVAQTLPPALRNLVTISRYLSDRRDTFTAWFANTGDIGASGDAKGKWARFFIFMEPGTAFGTPGAFANNAYTTPGDAADNRSYSGYPRLLPYMPPVAKRR